MMEKRLSLQTKYLASMLAVMSTASALIVWKASGALKALSTAQRTGTLKPKAEWIASGGTTGMLKVWVGTLNYFSWVFIALAFGVVLGAMVRALIPSRWLAKTLAAAGMRGPLLAAVVGAPLMLCSCCAAPVFEGVYERTRRLGPALTLLFAAPALNPAALVLTFLLFPAPIAWGRLGLSLALVLLAASGVGVLVSDPAPPDASVLDLPVPTWGNLGRELWTSLVRVSTRSLPAIVLGVLLSAALCGTLPIAEAARSAAGAWSVLLIVALVSLPIAMPTFGEIPIGLALLQAGAPQGAVLALLLLGPAVNLPSLLTVARVSSVRAALVTTVAVLVLALIGGAALLVQ